MSNTTKPRKSLGRSGARFNYYRRIFTAYLTPQKSQLTFWHETPELNEHLRKDELGEYYMTFAEKADYAGQYDDDGIPLLNYHGATGLQSVYMSRRPFLCGLEPIPISPGPAPDLNTTELAK